MWFASVVAAAVLMQAATGMQTIARDSMSGIDRPRQAVARTSAEWTALWREHAAHKAAPTVDFNTHTVLAVFLGTRSSAGYGVEIVGTRLDGTVLIAEWSERRPKPGQMAAQVITTPSHIVAVPKIAGEVRFEKVDR